MIIALANDHSALSMKNELKQLILSLGHKCLDFGTHTEASCDYPVFAEHAARSVASGESEIGILLCGTGIGMSLAANKVRGIRCANCSEPYSAAMARRHNNANMLSLGARVIGPEMAKLVVETFLKTPFEGGRHERRIEQISRIERGESL